MTDLLGLLREQLKGPVLDQLKSLLGTDPEKAIKAVETAAGAILAGLLQKASTPGGAESLLNTLKSAAPSLPDADDGSVFGGLGDILGSPEKMDEISRKGTDLAGSIFGAGKASSILSLLSSLLGLGGGITGKLLGLLLPLILGQISKVVLGDGKGVGGLIEILLGQKDALGKLGLPTNLLGELGINNLADLGKSINLPDAGAAVTSAASAAATTVTKNGLPSWLLPLLLIGILALAALYAARSFGPAEPVDNAPVVEDTTAPNVEITPPTIAEPAPAFEPAPKE